MANLIGSIDRLDAQMIEGWIALKGDANCKIPLEVMLDGTVIGQCVADQLRQDLADAGINDGYCAFHFVMPAFVPAASLRHVKLRIAGSPAYLENPLAAAAPADEGQLARATVSKFGGLWIDRYDFIDRLGQKHRHGEISDEVCDQIVRFVRDGYVVLKGAVTPQILQQLNDDIERVWIDPPPGLMIETFEPDGKMRYIPPDVAWRAGTTKLLDLYAASAASRVATAAPMAVAFLTAIFEAAPKAFQQLTFWNGSQQDMHKDTAYVKIDSSPMSLAASWLALEDISPGTGELEYYVGSHRAPDFLFGGVSKWMESNADEHRKFLQSLHDDAKAFSHVRKTFMAQAGDVLIWHADLAHGGSKIENASKTRRSLVTHFCPVSEEPFYRRESQHAGVKTNGVEFISQYGDVMQNQSADPAPPKANRRKSAKAGR